MCSDLHVWVEGWHDVNDDQHAHAHCYRCGWVSADMLTELANVAARHHETTSSCYREATPCPS